MGTHARTQISAAAVVVEKSATESVVVDRHEFRGHEYVDCRTWARDAHDKDSAPRVPTQKGLCASPDLWRRIIPALQQLVGDAPEGE